MKSKKFRMQRDSLKAINISMALFLKLLTKTCEVVQSTSTATTSGKRLQNTLDLDHLVKAVKRYEVLSFMRDIVDEMNLKKMESKDLSSVASMISKLDAIEERANKRKQDKGSDENGEVHAEDEDMTAANKKQKSSQMSITSFFKSN